MRTAVILLLILTMGSHVTAQSLPDSDAWWYDYLNGIVGYRTHFYYCGDTTIANTTYQKLMSNGNFSGGLRQDGELVYITLGQGEDLLYDFSLLAGDTIRVRPFLEILTDSDYEETLVVDSTYYEIINGVDRKHIVFQPLAWETEVWIEGIGSNFGVIYRSTYPWVEAFGRGICFGHDGFLYDWNAMIAACAIPDPEDLTCYEPTSSEDVAAGQIGFSLMPNPANDVLVVFPEGNFPHETFLEIYDGTGTLVLRQQLQGSSSWLDVSGLATGCYFVRVMRKGERSLAKKLLVFGDD